MATYSIKGRGVGANRSQFKSAIVIETGLPSIPAALDMVHELIGEYVFERLAPFYLSIDGNLDPVIDETDCFYEDTGAICQYEPIPGNHTEYRVNYQTPGYEPWSGIVRVKSRETHGYWIISILSPENPTNYGYRLSIEEETGDHEPPAWKRLDLKLPADYRYANYRFGFPRPL